MNEDMLDLLVQIDSEATAVNGHFQIKADWWEVDPAWIATHTDYPSVLDDIVGHAEPMMVPDDLEDGEDAGEEHPSIVLPFAVMEAIWLWLAEYHDE